MKKYPKKLKLRTILIEDELWIPFINKYKSACARLRELIKNDLETS